MINHGRALFSRVLHSDTEVENKPLKKKTFPVIFDDPEFPGLPFGTHEEKRKELIKERNLDYNKFLEVQNRTLFSRIFYPVKDPQTGILRWKVLPLFSDDSEFLGLPLGAYEEKQKELIKERNLDYNKFLEEKEKQEEFKRYARKLQSEFGIIIPDPKDFATSMLTSNNIFGFAPPPYGQHSNGLLPYVDPRQTKEEYRQALQQQINDQKKRKEMEKLQDMQSTQKQSLYQPSFIDGSAHRRPYLMQQSGDFEFGQLSNKTNNQTILGANQSTRRMTEDDYLRQSKDPSKGTTQTSISPSMSVDSLEQVSTIASIPPQINAFPVMPTFPQTMLAPPLNTNSGLLFESESDTRAKDKEFYREDLRRQIEEKKRREEEEKARVRMEEECLALRIEQQRLRMLQEYENERQKKLQKEEEQRRKQERLWQIQEQQRKEAEDSRHLLYKRKLEEAEKGRAAQKIDNSDLTLTAPVSSQSPLKKPEIPSPPTDPRTQVLSQLSLIRQQLHEEKKHKKEMLQQKKTYQVMDRADDDDSSIPNSYNAEQGDVN